MKINGNEVRPGNILDYEKSLWVVVKAQHVKPGKGPAYMQAEMKNLQHGTKVHKRFRSDETLEKAFIEERDYQYLYKDGDSYVFMDMDNYEQINLPAEDLEDQVQFLQDGMQVRMQLFENNPIAVNLPNTVILEIVEADAVVKGQTASSSFKPAVLENGLRIMVPPHIGTGTRVVVDTSSGEYVERAK